MPTLPTLPTSRHVAPPLRRVKERESERAADFLHRRTDTADTAVDDELSRMKKQLSPGEEPPKALPAASGAVARWLERCCNEVATRCSVGVKTAGPTDLFTL